MVKSKKQELAQLQSIPQEPVVTISYNRADLKPGEEFYVARVKLQINTQLRVDPGTVIVLGPEDTATGLNIKKMLYDKAMEYYQNDEQANAIKAWWENSEQARREGIRDQFKRG